MDIRVQKHKRARITDIQKKELYDLNTIFDIKQMDQPDKELLVAGLYTLAAMSDDLNDYQKMFVRSVQRYVSVSTPQTTVDLSIAIDNVENLTAQKAMMQVFMEFLFLENENDDYLDDYEELFDFFSVKKKERETILNQIHTVHNVTGAGGIAEKYGYVPPKPKRTTTGSEGGNDGEDGKSPSMKRGVSYDELFDDDRLALMAHRVPMSIDTPLMVEKDEEMVIRDKNVKVNALISVKGTLIFENCEIDTTGMGTNADSQSFDLFSGKIHMVDCEFKKEGENDSIIIKREKCELYLENCYFNNVHAFCNTYGVSIATISETRNNFAFKRCLFENGDKPFISSFWSVKFERCSIVNHIDEFLEYVYSPFISHCEFTNDESHRNTSSIIKASFMGYGVIDNCLFENNRGVEDFTGSIRNSEFIGASALFNRKRDELSTNKFAEFALDALTFAATVKDTGSLKASIDIVSIEGPPTEEYNASLERGDCQVINCKFTDVSCTCVENADLIANCIFTATKECSVSGRSYSDGGTYETKGYIMVHLKEGATVIKDCIFKDITLISSGYFYLVGHEDFSKKSYKQAKIYNSVFENCVIKDGVRQLIHTYAKSNELFSAKTLRVISIQNSEFTNCSPSQDD